MEPTHTQSLSFPICNTIQDCLDSISTIKWKEWREREREALKGKDPIWIGRSLSPARHVRRLVIIFRRLWQINDLLCLPIFFRCLRKSYPTCLFFYLFFSFFGIFVSTSNFLLRFWLSFFRRLPSIVVYWVCVLFSIWLGWRHLSARESMISSRWANSSSAEPRLHTYLDRYREKVLERAACLFLRARSRWIIHDVFNTLSFQEEKREKRERSKKKSRNEAREREI